MPYIDRERHIAETARARRSARDVLLPELLFAGCAQGEWRRPRIINVVHDVQFAALPELFSEGRLRWLNREFAAIRRNADHVVFISEATKQHYIELFGEPRQHSVIYNPIEISETAGTSLDDGAPFLLASIHNHPHKNFAGPSLALRQARGAICRPETRHHGPRRRRSSPNALPRCLSTCAHACATWATCRAKSSMGSTGEQAPSSRCRGSKVSTCRPLKPRVTARR